MFLMNNRSGKMSAKTSGQITKAAHVIIDNNMSVYIHTPYLINLCSNPYDPQTGYLAQQYLNEDLYYGVAMGCK